MKCSTIMAVVIAAFPAADHGAIAEERVVKADVRLGERFAQQQ